MCKYWANLFKKGPSLVYMIGRYLSRLYRTYIALITHLYRTYNALNLAFFFVSIIYKVYNTDKLSY